MTSEDGSSSRGSGRGSIGIGSGCSEWLLDARHGKSASCRGQGCGSNRRHLNASNTCQTGKAAPWENHGRRDETRRRCKKGLKEMQQMQ